MAKGKKKDKKKDKAKDKAAKLELAHESKSKAKHKSDKKHPKKRDHGLSKSAKMPLDVKSGYDQTAEKASVSTTPAQVRPQRQAAIMPEAGDSFATPAKPVSMPDEEKLFSLSNLFKIFADPTRLKILYALAQGPTCVADIAQAAGVTQGATSHQLRSMKQERMVDFVRDGKQVFYSLADERVLKLLALGDSYISE